MLQQKLKIAKSNAKSNAKKGSELRETKKAENDALVAQGIGIDAALRPDVVETIALKVVKKIEKIVDDTYSLLLSAESMRSLLPA